MSPTAAPWMTRTVPASIFEALVRRHRLSPLAARVLAARGWQPGPALSDYLAPQAVAPDPLALTGAPEAAERLWRAIDAGERITVAGDYDVDGITGAALLKLFLEGAGATVDCHLPNRHQEGYGLQIEALRELAAAGTRVLVTVDNGTTSLEEIAFAKTLGMDVIVTDHHQPGPELPEAYALLNPRLMVEPGPFAPLAGVGVAYQLTKAMEALRHPCQADAALDLVAIGTIGDRAPLSGENRRLVKLGLQRLAASPRAGLAALCKIVNLELGPNPGAEAIALRLVPRLNAAGRMADPRLALDLLLTEDPSAGARLAERLERLNRERQRLTRSIEAGAKALLEAGYDPEAPAIV
ncbi:MAG: single-stranded-DNA-specific exonuclease RecJ, partial [Candidatus Sericytochromatia bacterium]